MTMVRAVIVLAAISGVVESFSSITLPLRRISHPGKYGFIQGDVDSRRHLGGATHVASTTSSSTLEYDIDSWSKGFRDIDSEDQYLMEPSEGSIPEDIEGTFFRNGPGKFKIGEDQIKHPFDGDGMVMAISFSKEGAYFRNRFVRTKGFVKESEAGRQLYRGFGNLPGGPLRNAFRVGRKNLANTNIHYWGGNLLALWEGGLPYRLDSKSLDTLGESDLGGTIDEKRRIFSAHPRIDPKNQRLVGFGSHNIQEVVIYEYDKDFKLKSRAVRGVKGLAHDFVVTDNYYVFYSGPIELTPLKWVLGLETMGSAIRWEGDKRGATLYIIPRDSSSKDVQTIEIPAGFCFHLANGFEDPNTGEVVVDLVEVETLVLGSGKDPSKPIWEGIDFSKEVPPNKLHRYRLDVSSPSATLVSKRTLYNKNLDFPVVNPRVSCQEHRYIWASCGRPDSEEACPVQGVVKIDTEEGASIVSEKWFPEPHEFLSECTFVPRKGATVDAPEDYGYLISVLVNGRDHRTDVVIFDAANVSKGPVCRLPLKGFVGFTLHGTFAPELIYTPEQIEKSFALTDLFGRKGWNVAKSEFSGLGLNSVLDE